MLNAFWISLNDFLLYNEAEKFIILMTFYFRKSESEVAQSCLTLCIPMDCSPPGSSVHGILQTRTLEWVAISSSRGSSRPRDQTQVSHIAGRFFTIWATREALWGLMMATDHFILLWWICKSHVVSSWNWTGPWWFELFGMVKEIFIYSRPSL